MTMNWRCVWKIFVSRRGHCAEMERGEWAPERIEIQIGQNSSIFEWKRPGPNTEAGTPITIEIVRYALRTLYFVIKFSAQRFCIVDQSAGVGMSAATQSLIRNKSVAHSNGCALKIGPNACGDASIRSMTDSACRPKSQMHIHNSNNEPFFVVPRSRRNVVISRNDP